MAPPSPRGSKRATLRPEVVDLGDGFDQSGETRRDGFEHPGELIESVRFLLLGQMRMEQLLEKLAQAIGSINEAEIDSPPSSRMRAPPPPVPARWDSEKKDIASDGGDAPKEYMSEGDVRGATRTIESLHCLMPEGPLVAMREAGLSESPDLPAWFEHLEMRSELKGSEGTLQKELSKRSDDKAWAQDDLRLTTSDDSPGRLRRLRWFPVLAPSSKVRFFFDMASLLVLTYDMISVPYFVAFASDHSMFTRLSYLSVAYWIVDMLINFRTGFYSKGDLEMRPAVIACNYLAGVFIIDFSVVAVDIAAIAVQMVAGSGAESNNSIKLMRIFKISRLVRLSGILRLRRLRAVLERLSNARQILPTFFFLVETFLFVVIFLWLNHVLACLWCFMARAGQSDTGLTWLDLETGDLAYRDYGDAYQYSTALHWAITQMTPGSMQVAPQNSAERAYNIACLVAGLVVFSTLISAISARVTSFRIQMQSHRTKMDELTTLLERTRVSGDLRLSICKQADARLQESRPCTVNDLAAVSRLSLPLRSALQLELCEPYLLEHPFMTFVSEGHRTLWKELCNKCVDFSMLMQKDTLFISGAQAVAMHFVTMGMMSYTVDHEFQHLCADKICPVEVEPGKRFSEAALWCHWRHVGCAEVRAARHCEVLSLHSDKFLATVSRDPLVANMAWSYGRSFFEFLSATRSTSIYGFPNDLKLPFGVDEAIASMPKDATICCSQVAIKLLRSKDATLAGWLQTVRADNTEQLIREVRQGGSTLLATKKKGVVRCLPLVVMRLTREDGRMLVRLRLIKKADGVPEATCKLPACKQEAGEHPKDCLQRLMQEKLEPLSDGFVIDGVEKQSEESPSRQYGVPTRYVRTVISATWEGDDDADAKLREFMLDERRQQMPLTCGTQNSRPDSSRSLWTWVDAEIYAFPSGDLYAWITQEEFIFFGSRHGQKTLHEWLKFLGKDAPLTPALSYL